MITIDTIEERSEDIKRWLSEDLHFANVYSLHTYDEGLASAYFGELKQRYPDNDLEKIVTLWKWFQRNLIDEGELHLRNNQTIADCLIEQFGYVKNSKNLETVHKERINEILSGVEEAIRERTGNFIDILGEPGVYRNRKSVPISAIAEIKTKLSRTNEGIVLDDEWNEFTVFTPHRSNMFMFHWSTGA